MNASSSAGFSVFTAKPACFQHMILIGHVVPKDGRPSRCDRVEGIQVTAQATAVAGRHSVERGQSIRLGRELPP